MKISIKFRRVAARYCKRTWRLVRMQGYSGVWASKKGESTNRHGAFFIRTMVRDVKEFYGHRIKCLRRLGY